MIASTTLAMRTISTDGRGPAWRVSWSFDDLTVSLLFGHSRSLKIHAMIAGGKTFLFHFGSYAVPIVLNNEVSNMAKKFDPAPVDQHAADPKETGKADTDVQDKLEKGLEGSFPASDPPSSTQPAKSEPDA